MPVRGASALRCRAAAGYRVLPLPGAFHLTGAKFVSHSSRAPQLEQEFSIPVFSTGPVAPRPTIDASPANGAFATMVALLSNDENFQPTATNMVAEVKNISPHFISAKIVQRQSLHHVLDASLGLSHEIISEHPDIDKSLRDLRSLGNIKRHVFEGLKDTYSCVVLQCLGADDDLHDLFTHAIDVLPASRVESYRGRLRIRPKKMRRPDVTLHKRAVCIRHSGDGDPPLENKSHFRRWGRAPKKVRLYRLDSIISVLTDGRRWQFYLVQRSNQFMSTPPLDLENERHALAIVKLIFASVVGNPKDFVKFAAVS
ncbi:hypothetical protein HMN09_01424300 [Mycena chlorophos]|uniref:Uncharacterized protein n=1 Tax=Mycena chlorophos TaxID=658473 RepID=A0A8H6RXE0_MYCCL|nr:hypothetical protein HMN09_01424300 [Mycena chlorophos]